MKIKFLVLSIVGLCISGVATADLFFVKTSEGPGFSAPEEVAVVLENGILPTFAMLKELRAKKKIVAMGLPAGSRSIYMIVDAQSHDEVDRMLRKLPAWGVFSWHVKPLQSIDGREQMEREILKSLKSSN